MDVIVSPKSLKESINLLTGRIAEWNQQVTVERSKHDRVFQSTNCGDTHLAILNTLGRRSVQETMHRIITLFYWDHNDRHAN